MGREMPRIAHALTIFNPIFITWIMYDGSLFSVHVGAMSLTFLFLLPQGVNLASRAVMHKDRRILIRNHFVLQLVALTLSLAGVTAMFVKRHSKGKPHFSTLHAWIGVASLFLTELVGLMGLMAYFAMPTLSHTGKLRLRAVHRVLGRLTYVLGTITILAALKLFDKEHPRNKGWKTYVSAASILLQSAALVPLLWPSGSSHPVTMKSGRATKSPGPDQPVSRLSKKEEDEEEEELMQGNADAEDSEGGSREHDV